MVANARSIPPPPTPQATGTGAPRPERPELPWWRKVYKTWGARLGFTLAAVAIYIGYTGRDERRIFAEHGLGYMLGIIGSLLILTLLLYPLRKRIRFLKILGPVKDWFRVHMILGVVGPLAVLYHANFSLGSVNSNVALVSMLLVAGSGLVGRFLYAKVHKGLFGRKANLKELLAGVKLSTAETGGAAQFVPDLMNMVAEYDRQVLQPPKSTLQCFFLPLKLMFQTRAGGRRIVRAVSVQLHMQARTSAVVHQHRKALLKATRKFVREHLRRVRRVAAFAAYERLFALWHKVHLPFFYLLLVTAIVHVIAVHAYKI